MAVSTSSYFNSNIVGQMQAGSAIDLYKISATPEFAVGTPLETTEGRYRYVHAGAATNRGVIVSQDFSEVSAADTDNVIIAPSSTYQMANETPGIYPGSIGSRYVVITLASITADEYAGGHLSITDDVGEGYVYRIRGNTATDDPASGKIRLELYDKIQVALTATTDFAITGNMYNDVEVATTGTDAVVAGVTMASLTATEPYGWIKTRGIATVLCDRAGGIGQIAALSDDIAGAYQDAAGGGTAVSDLIAEPLIGYIVSAGDTTGHGVIYLQIE